MHALACGALALAKAAVAAPRARREGPRAGLRGAGSGDDDAVKGMAGLCLLVTKQK